MVEVVNLKSRFAAFDEHWSPRIAGEVNDCLVKLVKFKGEFVWHHHEREDELFWVVKGWFRIKVRGGVAAASGANEPGSSGGATTTERELIVREGEFVVIPRGLEHMPVADEECHVVLIEPKTTLNTGNVRNERTRDRLERI